MKCSQCFSYSTFKATKEDHHHVVLPCPANDISRQLLRRVRCRLPCLSTLSGATLKQADASRFKQKKQYSIPGTIFPDSFRFYSASPTPKESCMFPCIGCSKSMGTVSSGSSASCMPSTVWLERATVVRRIYPRAKHVGEISGRRCCRDVMWDPS